MGGSAGHVIVTTLEHRVPQSRGRAPSVNVAIYVENWHDPYLSHGESGRADSRIIGRLLTDAVWDASGLGAGTS